MKKSLLLTIGITLLASATGLAANTDWIGKFWGDREGEWSLVWGESGKFKGQRVLP